MSDNNDPIVLYLIVRESLNMGAGKIAAQAGHGVQYILIHYFRAQLLKTKLHDDSKFPAEEAEHIKITTEWLVHLSRKVVLKADDKEFERVKNEFKDCVVVKDAGLTEVAPNSETVIALWPQYKSKAHTTVIKRLQVLK